MHRIWEKMPKKKNSKKRRARAVATAANLTGFACARGGDQLLHGERIPKRMSSSGWLVRPIYTERLPASLVRMHARHFNPAGREHDHGTETGGGGAGQDCATISADKPQPAGRPQQRAILAPSGASCCQGGSCARAEQCRCPHGHDASFSISCPHPRRPARVCHRWILRHLPLPLQAQR